MVYKQSLRFSGTAYIAVGSRFMKQTHVHTLLKTISEQWYTLMTSGFYVAQAMESFHIGCVFLRHRGVLLA